MASATFFPRFVCRVGGLPYDVVEGLTTSRSCALLDRLAALEAEMACDGEAVAEAIGERIGGLDDKKARSRLLGLRRDVYNRRPIRSDRLAGLDADLRPRLEAFAGLQNRLETLRREVEEVLDGEVEGARSHLRRAIDDPAFQEGLLLSSRVLYDAQRRYLSRPPSRLRAKERQIERGLLQYLIRAATKATPFATFCTLLPGTLVDEVAAGEGARHLFDGSLLPQDSRSRLNKAFFSIAFIFFVDRPELRRHLYVRPNPTLRRLEDGTLHYLSMATAREVFQRLPSTDVIEVILELLGDGRRRTGGELIRELAALQESEDPGALEAIGGYLDRLIEIGLLHGTTDIPSQALDWDRRLIDFLAPIDAPRARISADLLRRLVAQAERYGEAPVIERRRHLVALERTLADFREEHGFEAARVTTPLYVDATAAAEAKLDRAALEPLVGDLRTYVELTARAAPLRRQQMNMRHFFDTFYAGRRAVPVLDFYEDYYREHYKEYLARQQAAEKAGEEGESEGYDLTNPFGLDSVARARAGLKRLPTLVSRRWAELDPAAETAIDLTSEDLQQALGEVDPLGDLGGWSASIFAVDLGAGEGHSPRLLLRQGSYSVGYGKMFSRFLDLFPPAFTDEVQERNRQLSRGRLAELCDDANFNANLHPPLLDDEISYPIGESRGSGGRIDLTDLEVHPDRGAPILTLRHRRDGRRVSPIDTGFLAQNLRPPLYKLLAAFSPASSFRLPLPLGSGPHFHPDSPVTVRPRITFNRRIVLYRRAWQVPGPIFPRLRDGESELDYFARVHRWRRRHALPDQVYASLGELHGAAAELAGSRGDDPLPTVESQDRKPHFIDFRSPLLVTLFGRLAPEHDRFMATLEERLPGPEALPRHRGRPYATELVLQLDLLS